MFSFYPLFCQIVSVKSEEDHKEAVHIKIVMVTWHKEPLSALRQTTIVPMRVSQELQKLCEIIEDSYSLVSLIRNAHAEELTAVTKTQEIKRSA
ncbi:hypothetical protein L596_016465 [Steinernema carpocapsae]|uniref:Uncharacterized protein n=1 Tax=Steinernema carpocapsae TaxID=34508 RepID=A0A4U5NIU8_STECR|nr:hypothetical protein L596_016465 [Steinernema carpocapsae]